MAASGRLASGAAIAAGLQLASPIPGEAGNGLNLSAVGFEPTVMGGADLAVSRDAMALAANPAGLTKVRGWNVEQHAGLAFGLDQGHTDPANDTVSFDNRYAFQGNAALAYGLTELPVTLAAGLFSVGGTGAVYEDLVTPFGTRDELSASFGIVRLAAGGAVRLGERWSAGVSVGYAIGLLNQEVFPNTSVAGPQPFVGTRISEAVAQGWSARIGLQYRPTDTLTIGIAYAPKTELPIEGDRLVANFTAQGLGKVQYDEVKIRGLALAQEVGIGGAWQATPRLLLAFDLSWLDWSNAMQSSTLRASDPEDPRAPSVIRAENDLDWRDQYVIALGAAFEAFDGFTLYGGWNYGRNPVPGRTTQPLLAPIAEHEVDLGFAWQVTPSLRIGLGVEWQLPAEVRYENPSSPLGPEGEERLEYVGVNLGASLRW